MDLFKKPISNSQKGLSQNYQKNLQHNKENLNLININHQNKCQNQEVKMEIEPNASNELITSGSTNYSNNTHLSMEILFLWILMEKTNFGVQTTRQNLKTRSGLQKTGLGRQHSDKLIDKKRRK